MRWMDRSTFTTSTSHYVCIILIITHYYSTRWTDRSTFTTSTRTCAPTRSRRGCARRRASRRHLGGISRRHLGGISRRHISAPSLGGISRRHISAVHLGDISRRYISATHLGGISRIHLGHIPRRRSPCWRSVTGQKPVTTRAVVAAVARRRQYRRYILHASIVT